jgi:hypothetical protein
MIVFAMIAASIVGCASRKASSESTTRSTPGMQSPDSSSWTTIANRADATSAEKLLPILYHRTGGIAGTDDRIVIWPGGLVQVTGRIIPSGTAHIDKVRVEHLSQMFAGWDKLSDRYLATGTADAYLIKIYFGDKSVEASDLATDLPPQFRQIYTEIEAIAATAVNSDEKPAP